MRDHMQNMRDGMQMMSQMMIGSMGQSPMEPCQDDDTQCRMGHMESQQQMMAERMSIMHSMMDQMLQQMDAHEHNSEEARETDD